VFVVFLQASHRVLDVDKPVLNKLKKIEISRHLIDDFYFVIIIQILLAIEPAQ
jgi:hypothetical protein